MNMEVDGDVDSKKKLDQLKREVEQLRTVDEFTDLPPQFFAEQKQKWRQELQDIEQRRNDLSLPKASENQEVVAEAAEFTGQKSANVLANRSLVHRDLTFVVCGHHTIGKELVDLISNLTRKVALDCSLRLRLDSSCARQEYTL